jgi:hypothetical protein
VVLLAVWFHPNPLEQIMKARKSGMRMGDNGSLTIPNNEAHKYPDCAVHDQSC